MPTNFPTGFNADSPSKVITISNLVAAGRGSVTRKTVVRRYYSETLPLLISDHEHAMDVLAGTGPGTGSMTETDKLNRRQAFDVVLGQA